MKKQILAIIQKQSDEKAVFSVGIVLALASSSINLVVSAQSYSQNNLPPEVIPMSQTINYGSNGSSNISSSSQIPGLASSGAINNAAVMQTPQESIQAFYRSLTGSNAVPQSNGQATNQSMSMPMNMNASQSFNANQTMPQAFNNQMDQSFNSQTAQNNLTMAAPPQSQTLTGPGNPQPATQQRTSGGISHLLGTVTSLGMTGYAVGAGGGNFGGLYNAGYLGAGLMNTGINNGIRF